MKVCTRCGLEKKTSDFGNDKTLKSGMRSYCKVCANDILRDWKSRNKHKSSEYYQKYKSKVLSKYKDSQLKKQEANKCVVCGCSLIGRQLSAKYCHECHKEIKKQWKKDSYKRNIPTVLKYNSTHRDMININNRKNEQKRRDNLSDRYVVKILREKSGFTTEQIKNNPELIEVKRLIIKANRL